MRLTLSALAAVAVLFAPQVASAQCATCGNPAVQAGGQSFSGEQPGSGFAAEFIYGYLNLDDFVDGENNNAPVSAETVKDLMGVEDFRMTVHSTTLIGRYGIKGGHTFGLVVPAGYPITNKGGTPKGQFGIGDLDLSATLNLKDLISDKLPALSLRLGTVIPTGTFSFAGTAQAVAAEQYVSLGRGSYWGSAGLSLFGKVTDDLSYLASLSYQQPLNTYETDAGAGQTATFRFGQEVRASAGLIYPLKKGEWNLVLQADFSQRGAAMQQLAGETEATPFEKTAGSNANLMPAVSWTKDKLTSTLAMTYPVYFQVKSVDIIPDPSVYLSFSYRFGSTAPTGPKPAIEPGDAPIDPNVMGKLPAGKITIVDYWADWCLICKKITPGMKAYTSAWDDVHFIKVDATDWEVAEFEKYLPAQPALPVIDIFNRNGKLHRRISGEACSEFVNNGYKLLDELPGGGPKMKSANPPAAEAPSTPEKPTPSEDMKMKEANPPSEDAQAPAETEGAKDPN